MPRRLPGVVAVPALTDPDCTLNGKRLALDRLPSLSSPEICQMVKHHSPNDLTSPAKAFDWAFAMLPLTVLRYSLDTGDEPAGGWKAAYLRHQANDEQAVRDGSPEYAGRQAWCAHWVRNTALYPLVAVEEEGEYWLWDGHHRLASAFWHDAEEVAVFVGRRPSRSD